MDIAEMKRELIRMRKKSLDRSSRWYQIDLENFAYSLGEKDDDEITRIYETACTLNSAEFEKYVQNELNILDSKPV